MKNKKFHPSGFPYSPQELHEEIMQLIEKQWGITELKLGRLCAFPKCRRLKKAGAFCSAHTKQKHRRGPQGMTPIGLTTSRNVLLIGLREHFNGVRVVKGTCTWPDCSNPTIGNRLLCGSCSHKWCKIDA